MDLEFGGGNSQCFLIISSRNLKGLSFFTTSFIDEISISKCGNKDQHSNCKYEFVHNEVTISIKYP